MLRSETIGNATLYLGDCRDILPALSADSVITDPPWDQAKNIPGADDPRGLFTAVAPALARAIRAVVHLGCYTDPAFLAPLSALMPFRQVLWLEYNCSSYRGRTLVNADVAYAFGEPIPSRPNQRVIPAKTASPGRMEGELAARGYGRNRSAKTARAFAKAAEHPMPRQLRHVRWLVRWWSEAGEVVLDPFMGSGTTGVAAIQFGRRFIGIETHEPFFDLARRRIEKAVPDLVETLPKGATQDVGLCV